MLDSITGRKEDTLEWRDFLIDRPPGTRAFIDRAAYQESFNAWVSTPEIQLQCDGICQCMTFFKCKGKVILTGGMFGGVKKADVRPEKGLPRDAVVCFTCEKCLATVKSYSLRFWSIAASQAEFALVDVEKLAECPPFSPRTPGKVISLVGPDREIFLKGRRAEIEGLGVGAFAYYRRIIERQKNRLLDEIIRVAQHLNAPAGAIACLEAAKTETQFSKAVENVKDAIPSALYIKGHNPFTLLHGALSEGLHDGSDQDCLVAASDIRLILIEFADRLADAMKEQRELDAALTRLMSRKKQS
jgi:hypothetical protein